MEAEKIKTPMQVLEKYTSIPQHYDVRVIKAMEEYASQFKQPPVSVMPSEALLNIAVDVSREIRIQCKNVGCDDYQTDVIEGNVSNLFDLNQEAYLRMLSLSKEAPKEQDKERETAIEWAKENGFKWSEYHNKWYNPNTAMCYYTENEIVDLFKQRNK